mmetsp:Transcript_37410/g.58945  ORF Transcript_37410/g.58945 Transcript_37410/m.58945 type:complete len:208 (-) Transcript_37410:476-1099(-)
MCLQVITRRPSREEKTLSLASVKVLLITSIFSFKLLNCSFKKGLMYDKGTTPDPPTNDPSFFSSSPISFPFSSISSKRGMTGTNKSWTFKQLKSGFASLSTGAWMLRKYAETSAHQPNKPAVNSNAPIESSFLLGVWHDFFWRSILNWALFWCNRANNHEILVSLGGLTTFSFLGLTFEEVIISCCPCLSTKVTFLAGSEPTKAEIE